MRNKTPTLLTCAALALVASPGVAEDAGGAVTVTLTGLPSTEGRVYVGLCDAAGWETFKCMNAMLTPDPDGVTHTWDNVAPGTYGITVLHDENGNGKMDFNFFGAPKEKWGSSNNPPPRMGRSKWEDVQFTVADADLTLTIRMQ
ncbi:MAG: DUF2141 domain-containing protein [Pseudomonadota bacterium]